MKSTSTTSTPPESANDLRQRAEEKLSAKEAATPELLSPEETKQLLHELQVHQIELEMQNEELRRTQDELESSRAHYFDLYDLAPVGYLTISEHGLIQQANLAAATMFGVARVALVNQPIFSFILIEDQDIHYLHRKQLLDTGEPQECDLRMVKTDGTAFWVHLALSTEQDSSTNAGQSADGVPVLRVLLSDITERKQAEEALKKLNEELEKRVAERTAELRDKDQLLLLQSRQAAMGEMIGNIAHQWRQPLNTLGLYIQRLKLFSDSGLDTKELLATTTIDSMQLINHMSLTIDDFRNYFAPNKEKFEFKVGKALKNTLSLLEGSLQTPKINIEIIEKDDPAIFGFKNEFSQVLLNILINARDALIENEISDPRVTITMYCVNGCAVVTIADNAGGIPEEIFNKIFDPYFTTKGPQGTGVGLFMSKAIIEKNMGGELAVRNTTDGAEFRIEVCNEPKQ